MLALQTVIQTNVFKKDMLHKISSALSQFPGLGRYFPRWGQGSFKASGIIRLRNALSLHKLIHSSHKHATTEHLKQHTTNVTRSQSKPPWFLITHSKRRLMKKHILPTASERHGKRISYSFPLLGQVCKRDSMTSPQLFHRKRYFINKHLSPSIFSCIFYF